MGKGLQLIASRRDDKERRYQVAGAAVTEIIQALKEAEEDEKQPDEPQGGDGQGEGNGHDEGQGGGGGGQGQGQDDGGEGDSDGQQDEGGDQGGSGGKGGSQGGGQSGDGNSSGGGQSGSNSQDQGNRSGGCGSRGNNPFDLPEIGDKEAPSTVDGSLLGAAVKNSTAKPEDLPKEIKVSDSVDGTDIRDCKVMKSLLWKLVCKFAPTPELAAEYKQRVIALRPYISAINAALRFRNNDTSAYNHGLESGDLDEGSLHKLALRERTPAIWERKELHGQPKVAIGLLLDESGSMKPYYNEARDVAIAMYEALRAIKGIDVMIIGQTDYHTPKHGITVSQEVAGPLQSNRSLTIMNYVTKQEANHTTLMRSSARSGTPTYYALDYAARKMMDDYPNHPRRVLFNIEDGQPNSLWDSGTGVDQGTREVNRVVKMARRNDIQTYSIGIMNAYDQAKGVEMYGAGNFVIIGDIMSSISILTAKLRQIATQI